MNAPVQHAEREPRVATPPRPGHGLGTETLETWRRTVLSGVAMALADPRLPELQRHGGVWKWNDQILYPSHEHLLVLENGCLKFELEVDKHLVLFSLWLQVGEVRAGVKVPNALLPSQAVREKLSQAYDGTTCQRTERIGQSVLFDWIWNDTSFAEFNFMVRSFRDPILGAVLADRMASIATHLYMAVANILIEAHGFKVSFKQISRVAMKGVAVQVRGTFGNFEDYARRFGYAIRRRLDEEQGRRTYWLLMPAERDISTGEITGFGNGSCEVLSVRQVGGASE